MRFRAPTLDPGVALAAAMLLALPGSALAEDANPPASDAATPPVAEEVTPPATPEAAPPAAGNASEPAKETNICFTGQGSIKEVLEACAAYIATAATGDKQHMVIAHSVRAMGMSATGDFDGALAEMNAAVDTDPGRANSYFMRAAAYQAKKDYDKAVADLDKAISLDATQGDFFLLRGIVYRDKNDLDKALVDMNQKRSAGRHLLLPHEPEGEARS